MFKISKKCSNYSIFLNTFLIQPQVKKNIKIKKKSKSSLVTLRSPKHFNKGKLKVININYKINPTKFVFYNIPIFIYLENYLFKNNILNKYNIFLSNNKSSSIIIKTKFKF